ncbi:hypothetical protein pb186bvf_006387 [Paramecium bursaria]
MNKYQINKNQIFRNKLLKQGKIIKGWSIHNQRKFNQNLFSAECCTCYQLCDQFFFPYLFSIYKNYALSINNIYNKTQMLVKFHFLIYVLVKGDKIIKRQKDKSMCERKRRPWTEEEDQKLKSIVESQITVDWELAAQLLKSRTAKLCRERYNKHLKNNADEDYNFTANDDDQLFSLIRQNGFQWTMIATRFPGKTDLSVKNQYHAVVRKTLRRLTKISGINKASEKINSIKTKTLRYLLVDSQMNQDEYSYSLGIRIKDLIDQYRTSQLNQLKSLSSQSKSDIKEIIQHLIDYGNEEQQESECQALEPKYSEWLFDWLSITKTSSEIYQEEDDYKLEKQTKKKVKTDDLRLSSESVSSMFFNSSQCTITQESDISSFLNLEDNYQNL